MEQRVQVLQEQVWQEQMAVQNDVAHVDHCQRSDEVQAMPNHVADADVFILHPSSPSLRCPKYFSLL